MNYFIKSDGEPHGPLSAEQIRLRLSEKGLRGSDLVRREDSSAWVPFGTLEEFREAAQQTEPLRNPMAAWSLVLGIGAVFVLLSATRPYEMASIVGMMVLLALIFGHLALSKIRHAPRKMRGHGNAIAGLTIGYCLIVISLIGDLTGSGSHITEKAPITKALSNCRQIITTLQIYASDHGGKYPDAALPDARSSNAVFRQLFVGGEADNEVIFGCAVSRDGNPDNNIGAAPDYKEAVQPNENHWAMTKGLMDASDGSIPLVFESPSVASWPPKWNADAAGTGQPGRTWSKGRVIIGFNDGSVALLPLESAKGEKVGLKPKADGKPVFPDLKPTPLILPVEMK